MQRHIILPFLILATFAIPTALGQDKQKDPSKNLITKETQQTIDAGLAYLVAEQGADGSWGNLGFKGDVAITSLAGLAFLAGGYQPGKEPHGTVVLKAVQFILDQESKALPGYLQKNKPVHHGPMFGHGYGVLFLAEVYGKIPDKNLKERVHAVLVRAIK